MTSNSVVVARNLFVGDIAITGTLEVSIVGFTTQWVTKLSATCPICNNDVSGTLRTIIDHTKHHAETDAEARLAEAATTANEAG